MTSEPTPRPWFIRPDSRRAVYCDHGLVASFVHEDEAKLAVTMVNLGYGVSPRGKLRIRSSGDGESWHVYDADDREDGGTGCFADCGHGHRAHERCALIVRAVNRDHLVDEMVTALTRALK